MKAKIAKRSKVQSSPRTSPASWLLAAGCVGLILSVSFVHGHVSADEPWRPQGVVSQSAQSTGAWDIQQEPVVEVDVDVRSEDDVALLQSMGYSCGIGVCELELPDGEELTLMELGLPVRTVARAIKVSGDARRSDARAALSAETYAFGANYANVQIRDGSVLNNCLEPAFTYVLINSAPAWATVTKVVYTTLIRHTYPGDLAAWVGNTESGARKVWFQQGGDSDGGYDDDPEYDDDIYLEQRELTFFNGDSVNQTWWLEALDCTYWNTGDIDRFLIWVYYWDCQLPGTPSTPSPANGATSVSRNADLDWADSAFTTSYDLYIGTSPDAIPFLATTTTSQYPLGPLPCGTRYYWQVLAKSTCGNTWGPIWQFTVAASPSTPVTPYPGNHATGIPLAADLDWADASPVTHYNVFFGTSSPPRYYARTTGSSLALPTLSPNTKYYWHVTAVNVDCSTAGPEWDFTTVCPNPATPTGASPFAGATNQLPTVDLSWTDPGDATSWDVYFGETTPPPFLGNTTKNYYTLNTLKCSAHYYWMIVAQNACGYTKGPIWDFRTTSLPAAPSGPTPASGAANQMLDMDLDWADSSRATSYDVYFGTTSPPPLHGNTAASYYALPDLTCATHYYWKIVAKNACGNTSGPVWGFSTTCCLPAAPSGPSPAAGAANQPLGVDLDWADASSATSYDVYFGTTASPPFWANTSASNYALPALTCNAHYYWKIVARNSCGGSIGPVWDFTTVCCMPGTPTGPSPADNAINVPLGANLDWGDVSGATSYAVYFGTSSPPPYAGSTTSSNYALPPLNSSTHYYWKVVARNSCGDRAGPVWNFTTQRGDLSWKIRLPIVLRQ